MLILKRLPALENNCNITIFLVIVHPLNLKQKLQKKIPDNGNTKDAEIAVP